MKKYVIYTEEVIRKGFVMEAETEELARVQFEAAQVTGTSYEYEDADYYQESTEEIVKVEEQE